MPPVQTLQVASHVPVYLDTAEMDSPAQVWRFLQRVSIACYAERCMIDFVRLSVCHSPVSRQNDWSYDHAVFTAG